MNKDEVIGKIKNHVMLNACVDDLLKIDGCILAGGAIRDIIIGKQPKDYDFFFTSEPAVAQALFLMKNHKSTGNIYTHTYDTPDGDIQLITKSIFESTRHIIDAFDFTPIQLAYDGKTLEVGAKTFDDIQNRKVGVNVITKPFASLERLERYIGTTNSNGVLIDGWNITDTYKYILDVMCTQPPGIILGAKRYDFE